LDLITKKSYTPERISARINSLNDAIENQSFVISSLRKELSQIRGLSLGLLYEITIFECGNMPATFVSNFNVDKINMHRFGISVRRSIFNWTEKGYSISSTLSIGQSHFKGQINQKKNTFSENLGWYVRGDEPYERFAYMNGIDEQLNLKSTNLGVGLSFSRVFNKAEETNGKLNLELEASTVIHRVNSARFGLNSAMVSFGGRFPYLNPEDTIFSGTGDFVSNVPLRFKDGNIPVDRNYLSYNIALKATYWFPKSKKYGINFGIGYTGMNLPFNGMNSRLFTSNDLGSYQSLWTRFGNQYLNAIQLNLGMYYKLM
jgi:hypothetical protein